MRRQLRIHLGTATAGYGTANRDAARIIAADPERYAGAMQDWARAVLSKEYIQPVKESEEFALWK